MTSATAPRIPESLAELRVPIDQLVGYATNPRRGDVKTIKKSLQRIGQYRPVVVNRGTSTGRRNEVLAGNHTVIAARELGWTEVAATFVDVDEDIAARIVLIDNRSNDLAGYDDGALLELLQSLPDLDATGFEVADLDALLGDDGLTPGKETEPDAPPKRAVSMIGDLIILGEHRVVCGDATSPEHMDLLLGADQPQLLLTDAPDDVAVAADALALGQSYCAPGAATFVWTSWRTYPAVAAAVDAAGLRASACIVWKKGRPTGAADFRAEHELCIFCRPDVDGDHDLCLYCAGDNFTGRGASDVWEVPRDSRTVHPAQKPIALAELGIEPTTNRGDVVLDLFGGTGSTLIAAENLGRRGRVIELDPAYVDVIVERWERHTGQRAERVRADG